MPFTEKQQGIIDYAKTHSTAYHQLIYQDIPHLSQQQTFDEKVLSKPLSSYVLSNRYQTNQVPEQMHALLPEKVRGDTYFVQAIRFAQHPEAYVQEMSKYKNVVIIGDIAGIESEDHVRPDIAFRQQQGVHALDITLHAAKTLNLNVKNVVYGMGDSKNATLSESVRLENEAKLNTVLKKYDAKPITLVYGADELALTAFSSTLPSKSVYVVAANPNQQHRYEGQRTTEMLTQQTLSKLGYSRASTPESADMILYINGASPQSEAALAKGYKYSNDSELIDFHQKFIANVDMLPLSLKKKTVYVDLTLPNGGFGMQTLPRSNDLLAIGAWGTANNTLGQTLAAGSILQEHDNPKVTKQSLTQSIIQDFGAQSYELRGRSAIDYAAINSKGTNIEAFKEVLPTMNQEVLVPLSRYLRRDLAKEFVIGGANPRTFEMNVYPRHPVPPFDTVLSTMTYNEKLAAQAPESFNPKQTMITDYMTVKTFTPSINPLGVALQKNGDDFVKITTPPLSLGDDAGMSLQPTPGSSNTRPVKQFVENGL